MYVCVYTCIHVGAREVGRMCSLTLECVLLQHVGAREVGQRSCGGTPSAEIVCVCGQVDSIAAGTISIYRL